MYDSAFGNVVQQNKSSYFISILKKIETRVRCLNRRKISSANNFSRTRIADESFATVAQFEKETRVLKITSQ